MSLVKPVNLAAQYSDWPEATRLALQSSFGSLKTSLVSELNAYGDYGLTATVHDICLAGSFGCTPGYGRLASDFDIKIIVSEAEPFISAEKMQLMANYCASAFSTNGIYRLLAVHPMKWMDISDRTQFKNKITNQMGSLNDVTMTSLVDGLAFKNAQEFYDERLA